MTWSRRLPAVAVAVLAAAAVPVGGAPAVAAPAPPSPPAPTAPAPAPAAPVLAITVDDSARQVEAGQPTRYKITLHSDGTAPVPLTVTVDAPPALTGLTPDSSGTVAGHTVRWQVTVPAGGPAELRLAGRVAGSVPADLGQLAFTACATLPDARAPIVCGTDLDRVTHPVAVPAPAWWRWPLIGLAGLLVLSVPGALLWQRRRRPAPVRLAG
jgi:hypothetical protein